MTPIENAAKIRRELITAMDEASAKLAAYCAPHRGDVGIVSDEIRKSQEYTTLNNEYYTAKNNLGAFMQVYKGKEYAKAFKAETIQHFNQKRGIAL